MARLSIDNVVQVNIGVASTGRASNVGNNIGLIIGSTSTVGTQEQTVITVKSLEEMITAGYTTSSPEYLAAQAYFNQKPTPTSLRLGYRASGQTAAQVLDACREADEDFYGVYICGAADADIVSAVTEAEDLGLTMVFFDNANPDCVVANPSSADIFTNLKSAGLKAGIGIYSETDYAGAALMGLAMGLEDGSDASAFDLYFKNLVGVETMDVTEDQIATLIEKGGNVYINRGRNTKLIDDGQCVNNEPYDEAMYIDLTQKVIRQNVLDVLTNQNVRKIPQTDDGMALILSAVTSAMEYMKRLGFVAPGVWTAAPFMSVNTGDVLSAGYMVTADSFDTLSAADRAQRKAPPVYVAMKLAGSVRSVVINVNVNQ